MSISYDELVSSLSEGDVITFKEYKLDRHERKKLVLSIENAIVKEVFPADETINRDKLVEIYGEELEDIDYMALSRSNCPRYLLNLGLDTNGNMNIKMITLNKDFYTMEQQEVEITGNMNAVDYEPSYVLAQGGWN